MKKISGVGKREGLGFQRGTAGKSCLRTGKYLMSDYVMKEKRGNGN